jgi:RNA polymerase sigma-70 factor, ECF subfamily
VIGLNFQRKPTMDYTRLDDETLLRLIARAQENALSELYDRYNRLVYSVALSALADPARAEDITQDVFVRVWEKAETYRPEQGRVASWLASITRNRAIDVFRRSRSRLENLQISWEDIGIVEPSAPQDIETEIDLAHRQQQVRWAVAQLPDEQKLALGLAFFQGLSHPEIAQALDEPLGTIKTRIRLGMQKLRQLLQGEFQV